MAQTLTYTDGNGVLQTINLPYPITAGGYGAVTATTGVTAPVAGPNISLVQGVTVKAHPNNTDLVYVGFDTGVSASTGYALSAGDPLFVSIDNANKIYAWSPSSGQTVCFMGS